MDWPRYSRRAFLGGLRVSFTQVRGKALWRGKVRQGGVPPSARVCQRMRCRTWANAFRMRRCQTEFRSDLPCCCCRVRSLDARKRRLSGRTAHNMRRVRLGWRGRRSQSVVTAKISAAIEACVGRRASFRWKCRRPGCKACPGYRDLPWLCHDAGAVNPGQRRGHRATVTIGALAPPVASMRRKSISYLELRAQTPEE